MNEDRLISLFRLFAYITILHPEVVYIHARSFIEKLLRNELNHEDNDYYLNLFQKFYDSYLKETTKTPDNKPNQQILISICKSISSDLPIKNRITITVHLLQFIKYYQMNHFYGHKTDRRLRNTIDFIAKEFGIKTNEYQSLCEFVFENLYQIHDNKNLLIAGKVNIFPNIKFMQRKNLKGQIYFLNMPSVNTIMFYYNGEDKIELNNNQIYPLTIYLFQKSSVISAENNTPIYYHEVIEYYLENKFNEPIHVSVLDVEYRFKKGINGIKKLTMHGESGELLGIMGASGTGKTTLMNILNGSIKPQKGSILINGHSIYDERINFQNVIGYVPQDDLLFEDLTVYKNLYYNAKLCFRKNSDTEIEEKVNNLLNELDLFEIRDLKVGSVLNKFISGGQRKRLNIALELIREPAILLLDEPTSGLSSYDAENIIRLLCEQTYIGKFVIINIHQPSSNVYKQIDQLLILDVGGYPIYFGKAMEAIKYFKRIVGRINPGTYECEYCGNINPEDIFQIIDEKKTSPNGEYLNERKIEPQEWYQYYLENLEKQEQLILKNTSIPQAHFYITSKLNQFKIFFKRQLLSRLSDKQYLIMIILISPALAFILGFFCKYAIGTVDNPRKYLFIENLNLPVYLFMSVISVLFVGMIISAEEIYRDRKIREREKFISLSNTSYINSKVLFLFMISAIQTLLFVVVGSTILQIKAMGLPFILILFSTSCCANMIGLNISSAFNSLVAIYILIPLMLVPQILLSGVIVSFDKLNYSMKSEKYVPIIGDIMVSRWAFEALAVEQFKNNEYQKYWFEIGLRKSSATYLQYILIPVLSNLIDDIKKDFNEYNLNIENMELLNNGLEIVNNKIKNTYNHKLSRENISISKLNEIDLFLENCKYFLTDQIDEIKIKESNISDSLFKRFNNSDKAMLEFKQNHYNNSIADNLLRRNEYKKMIIEKGKIIRKYEPIYYLPENSFGRAQFYAPVKKIGNILIDTLYFNLAAIWLMSLILYMLLKKDALRTFVNYFENKI